jgi:hypothetical protein
MYLALTGIFRARWTQLIQDEWIKNVLADYPDIPPERLETSRYLMNENVRDGLVCGFEALVPALNLPDPNDRHVLAAAIQGHSDIIVTFNLKDFPLDILKPYGVQAQHPDEFISSLIDYDEKSVCSAVKTHRLSLKKPPKTTDEFLEMLEQQGLPVSVGMLRDRGEWI